MTRLVKMGIKGLYSFIKHLGKPVSIRDASHMRFGIDISYFMHRWGTDDVQQYLDFINSMLVNNNRVLFVFDGKPSKHKETEIEQRRVAASAAEKYATSLQGAMAEPTADFTKEQLQILNNTIDLQLKRAMRPTKEKRQQLKRLFYENLIHMLKSSGEADELLVALNKEDDVDILISGDTDLIRLGARRIWVPLNNDDGINYLEFEYSMLLKALNLNERQFQEMCILTGGVPSVQVLKPVDIRKAWSNIRVYGTIQQFMFKNGQEKLYTSTYDKEIIMNKKNINENMVKQWIREDEYDRLEAWRNGLPPPYKY